MFELFVFGLTPAVPIPAPGVLKGNPIKLVFLIWLLTRPPPFILILLFYYILKGLLMSL